MGTRPRHTRGGLGNLKRRKKGKEAPVCSKTERRVSKQRSTSKARGYREKGRRGRGKFRSAERSVKTQRATALTNLWELTKKGKEKKKKRPLYLKKKNGNLCRPHGQGRLEDPGGSRQRNKKKKKKKTLEKKKSKESRLLGVTLKTNWGDENFPKAH